MHTQQSLDKAVAAAVAAERRRVASVFASPASEGRERVCADLLTSARGFSATSICAELPNLPTDNERGQAQTAAVSAQSNAVWERAFASNSPAAKTAAPKADKDTSESIWDKAYNAHAIVRGA